MGVEGWGLVEGRGLIGSNVGVGGDVGYEGCEPRKEGIVQCSKMYCTILRKIKKMWEGEGEGQYLNPKHSQCIKKKENEKKERKKKKMTETGLEPTTSGLEKPARLSTGQNTIIAITKYE